MSKLTELFGFDASKNANQAEAGMNQLIADLRARGGSLMDLGFGGVEKLLPMIMNDAQNYSTNPSSSAWFGQLFDNMNPAVGNSYDQAAQQFEMNMARRGVMPTSTAYSSGLSSIFNNEAANTAASRRSMFAQEGVRREQERFNRLNTAMGISQGVGNTGQGMSNAALGGLGGLKGMYDTEAANAIRNIGQLGSVFTGFDLGDIIPIQNWLPWMKKSADAGNNGLATNQSPSRPATLGVQPGSGYGFQPYMTSNAYKNVFAGG